MEPDQTTLPKRLYDAAAQVQAAIDRAAAGLPRTIDLNMAEHAALLTEAATAFVGKQALLRGLMDTFAAAGGEGVASLGAIEDAIKRGARVASRSPIGAMIDEAMLELAEQDRVVGLVVDYAGLQITLLPVTPDDPQRDSTMEYRFEATATADPVDDGPELCAGRGMTALEAIDACAIEVEDAESEPDEESGDE